MAGLRSCGCNFPKSVSILKPIHSFKQTAFFLRAVSLRDTLRLPFWSQVPAADFGDRLRAKVEQADPHESTPGVNIRAPSIIRQSNSVFVLAAASLRTDAGLGRAASGGM